jgi:hypothetical protein
MASWLFGKPKGPPTPAPPQKPPGLTDPLVRDQAQTQGPTAGYASTILTGGQGDTSTPSVAKKTLLGG